MALASSMLPANLFRSSLVRCGNASLRLAAPRSATLLSSPVPQAHSRSLSSMSCAPQKLALGIFPCRSSLFVTPSTLLLSSCRSFHTSPLRLRPETSATSVPTSPQSPTSVSTPQPSASTNDVQEPTAKAVGHHSIFLALLVYAIILVGGLTRLTESGLSITEWNPGFKGMWLPSTDEEWEGEWAKYRETPEFVL